MERPQYVVIVRRGAMTVYDTLTREITGVEVIWDRRIAERRVQAAPVAVERRRGERRCEVLRWRPRGFAVVRRPP